MAKDFDGTNDILKRGSPVTTATDNFTMSCWFNPDVALPANTKYMFVNGVISGTGGNGWDLNMQTSGVARFDLVFVAAVTGTTALSTGTWYHLLGVRNSGTSRLYVNGTEEGTSIANAPNTPSDNASIGARTDPVAGDARHVDGKIAECAIWTRALSTTEISELADGVSALSLITRGSLAAYLPLGRNDPETDRVSATTWAVTEAVAFAHPRIYYPSTGQIRRFTTAAAAATAVKDLIGMGIIPYAR